MKQFILMLSFILLFTGCSTNKSVSSDMISTSQQEAVEEMNDPAEQSVDDIVEVPIDIQEEDPSEITTAETVVSPVIDTVIIDGLVEDAVSFCFYIPVLSDYAGAETINNQYSDLSNSLNEYAKTTVYEKCLEQHTVADVTGTFVSASPAEQQLEITYTVEVKFADSDEKESFSRVDTFDLQTGELLSSKQ